jgi:hypothetical protein
VRVYDLTSGGAWVKVGADIDGEAAGDKSGYSLSLSSDGSRVAIGAYFNDGTGSDAGHTRVYELSGSAWVKVGADIDGEATGDNSGVRVSLSSDGSRVAISAAQNAGTAPYAGHVRVYDLTGGAWVKVGADIDGEAAYDQSGVSVTLSSDGSRVAIGAPGNEDGGNNAGHVRVYNLTGGAWVQVGSDIDGKAAVNGFGASVSLSSNGSRVVIGAIYNDDGGNNAGQVRVYNLTSGGGGGIPSEPRSLTVEKRANTTADLEWKAPKSLNGGTITDYVIQYRVSRTTLWSTFTDGISTSTKATVTGLTRNVKYVFQVSARTSGGDSPYSKAKWAS